MGYYIKGAYQMYYEIYGKGEPLLMIHGSTASSLMLKDEANYYSNYFKVIVVDMIGHGKSERVKEFPVDYWKENAKMLRGLCKKEGINRVNILGTSGGAIVALNFAINYPENTYRVIADSFVGEKLSLQEANTIKKEREKAKNNGGSGFWSYMHGEDWEKVIDADTNMLINYAKTYRNNFHSDLDKIGCPVLITGSLKDEFIDNIEKRLCNVAKKIKHSIILLSPDGVHPLMLSKKNFFRKVALNFLKENTLIPEERE
ncbi:prolyl aminopeptidase [Halothermothrix orenii H 168]|uniref:Prolyl aminopeptidase n=2 Tax=Halothermothrix orenii TaxID=31909 RepID=B8CXY3_HALOH|nr:prolyl aminopeptidase [Halothermothrix orenii H 168]